MDMLPTPQYIFVAVTGSLTILSSVYLLSRGYIMPIAAVVAVGLIVWFSWRRVQPSLVSQPPPSDESPSQFEVFRQMEPADQTRVNPWVGFLQEDVYANRTGPIGTFVGKNDYVKNAPLYPFQGTETTHASDISSCKLIERDLSKLKPSDMTALEAKCQADLDAVTKRP